MNLKEAIIELQEIAKEKDLTIKSRQALQFAISKLELLEKIGEVMPKKKEIPTETFRGCYNYICAENYNQAIDDCTAIIAKKLEGLEEIITKWFVELERKQSTAQVKEVERKGLWQTDLKSMTFEEIANGISFALRQYFLGKE